MKQFRKWCIGIFVMFFVVNMCNITVHASTIYTHEYFNYRLDGESVTITNYFGKESVVTVPNMIAGYPVSKIAAGSFDDKETVKHVNLPDTVMEVEKGAFGGGISVTYNSNTDNPQGTLESEVGKVSGTEDEKKPDTDTENGGDINQTSEGSVAKGTDTIDATDAGSEDSAEEFAKAVEEDKLVEITEQKNKVEAENDSAIGIVLIAGIIIIIGVAVMFLKKKKTNK